MCVNFTYQVEAVIGHASSVGWTDVGEIAGGTNRKELVHNVKMASKLYVSK